MNHLFNRGTTYLTGEPLNLSGPNKVLLITNQGLTPIRPQFNFLCTPSACGGVVNSAWLSKGSDIDFAVAGLKGSEFLRAWALLEDLFPERRAKLIEFETVTGSMQRAIEKNGLEL